MELHESEEYMCDMNDFNGLFTTMQESSTNEKEKTKTK